MILPFEVSIIIGAILAVILTIVLTVLFAIKKKDASMQKGFGKILFDFFNFKKLLLESVLRFLYVLSTIASITVGFFLLFGYDEYISYYGYYDYYDSYSYRESTALIGLILMVAGPIALRLVFEGLMMFILLVKNTIEINNKLKGEVEEAPTAPVVTVQTPVAGYYNYNAQQTQAQTAQQNYYVKNAQSAYPYNAQSAPAQNAYQQKASPATPAAAPAEKAPVDAYNNTPAKMSLGEEPTQAFYNHKD